MGIRSDIQTALTDAMDNELADVVAIFDLFKGATSGSLDDYVVADGVRADIDDDANRSRGIFEAYPSKEIDGTNIKTTDEKLIVNGVDITVPIEIDDTIKLLSGIEYSVVKPNPVMGGGTTPIIYEAQVRRNA